MESIDHGSTVMGNGIHTYDTLKQIDEQTTTQSITTEFNDHDNKDTAANGTVVDENGDLQSNLPSVAIYERPIFSQSQYVSWLAIELFNRCNRFSNYLHW